MRFALFDRGVNKHIQSSVAFPLVENRILSPSPAPQTTYNRQGLPWVSLAYKLPTNSV